MPGTSTASAAQDQVLIGISEAGHALLRVGVDGLSQLIPVYWSILVVCTVVPYFATKGIKIGVKDYVVAHYGPKVRPWWYRVSMFFCAPLIGCGFGFGLGLLDDTEYTWGQGIIGGTMMGFLCSTIVFILKWRARKAGVPIEDTSDLNTLGMQAVRREAPTDPVVTDPIGTSDDIPTDRPGDE